VKHATRCGIVLAAFCSALGGAIGTSKADTLSLPAAADTFINSGSPGNSAGGNAWFDAGADGQLTPGVRRGLLRFNLTSLPSGATITSAVVQLTVIRVPFSGPINSTFDLRRVTAAWGEGTNSGSSGLPAVTGDATWTARILGTANWTAAGALNDAAANASASTPVGSTPNATYLWSGAGLVSDVQLWLNNPSQNFGWLLTSQDEASGRTVRGFAARENGASVPMLQIGYKPPPTPPLLTGAGPAGQGGFRFAFTNKPGFTFSVLAATNVSLPISNWSVVGSVTDAPPGSGSYQFTDAGATTNRPRSFYRVRWP